jgi:hypothetical protein
MQAVIHHTHPAVQEGINALAAHLGVSFSELPAICLLRTADGHTWHRLVDGKLNPTTHTDARKTVLANSSRRSSGGGGGSSSSSSSSSITSVPLPVVSTAMAERIVKGIHRYYGGQVLEPSTQGFLSIIEKSFPRSDLYVLPTLHRTTPHHTAHGQALTGA